MKNFLYLLPFSNNQYFKVGITLREDFTRIIQHQRTYGIDLDKSVIVRSSSDSFIRRLETLILVIYKKFKVSDILREQNGASVDGDSEVLSMECWSYVLEDIEYFNKREQLGLQLIKGIELPKPDPNQKIIRRKVKPQDVIPNWEFLNQVLEVIKTDPGIYGVYLRTGVKNRYVIKCNDNMKELTFGHLRYRYPGNGGCNISSCASYSNEFPNIYYVTGSLDQRDSWLNGWPNAQYQMIDFRERFIHTLKNLNKWDESLSVKLDD